MMHTVQSGNVTLVEHCGPDRRFRWSLMDGRRSVAVSRVVGAGGYLITGHGVCLLDKLPSPTAKGPLGQVDPTRYHASNARVARKVMRRLFESMVPAEDFTGEWWG